MCFVDFVEFSACVKGMQSFASLVLLQELIVLSNMDYHSIHVLQKIKFNHMALKG